MSCDRVGTPDILAGFDAYSSEYPFFALYAGKDLKFVHKGDDVNEGRNLLQQNLDVLQRNGSNALFTLRFYDTLDKSGGIKKDTPHSGSFTFKVVQPTSMIPQGAGSDALVAYLSRENESLKEKVNELQEEKEELEEAIREYEDAEQQPSADSLGIIGTIGEAGNKYPWMQSFLGKLADSAGDLLTAGKVVARRTVNPQPRPSAVMNGVDNDAPDKRTNAALQELIRCYVRLHNMPVSTDAEIDAANMEAFKMLAADLSTLAHEWQDLDVMELSLKKLGSDNYKRKR
jgi:hypothetical protein